MFPYLEFNSKYPKHLVGFRDKDTFRVITSPIVAASGKIITTNSGSKYLLQDISQDYRRWLEENNIEYNPDFPFE